MLKKISKSVVTIAFGVMLITGVGSTNILAASAGTDQEVPPPGGGCQSDIRTVDSNEWKIQSGSKFIMGTILGLPWSWLSVAGGAINVAISEDPGYLTGWHVQTTKCFTQVSDFPNDEWEVEYQIDYWNEDWDFKGTQTGSYHTPPY